MVNMTQKRASYHPDFAGKVSQMALRLQPLVRVTTSEVHPAFPGTLLNYWALTSDQLDSLAGFYHQQTPSEWTKYYPCPVEWKGDLSLEGKRRKFGRFIGLRGTESPVKIMTEEEILKEARNSRMEEEQDAWRRKLRWYN